MLYTLYIVEDPTGQLSAPQSLAGFEGAVSQEMGETEGKGAEGTEGKG